MRVLLADDHGIVRRGLRSLLESEEGVTVVAEASDGLEALRLSEEHQPEILIVDIAMPLGSAPSHHETQRSGRAVNAA